jgi:hypothetical protein
MGDNSSPLVDGQLIMARATNLRAYGAASAGDDRRANLHLSRTRAQAGSFRVGTSRFNSKN